ncbi:MAG: sulfurtransferase [Peptococcaceae bacterium]|nr:MAG: sulfurtransferase [Peptococcaceae bacterium]
MKIMKKMLALGLVILFLVSMGAGCGAQKEQPTDYKPPEPSGTYAHPEYLISVDDVKKSINDPFLLIIDLRPRGIYVREHIPRAINFNSRLLTDYNRVGRMAPPSQFKLALREYGISNRYKIVVYGATYEHARLWFALYMYGHGTVQMLDGGIDKWKSKGYPVIAGRGRKQPAKYTPTTDRVPAVMATTEEVKTAMENTDQKVIIDARSAAEYKAGHIPGSVNVEWNTLLNEDKTFKNANELGKIFAEKGITPDKQIIVYSNQCYRSSYLYFVLKELLGCENTKNYDGFILYWKIHKKLQTGL